MVGFTIDFFALNMCAVKGLQIFATFPGHLSAFQDNLFEDILTMLVSIVTQNFKCEWLWNLALKALVNIGFYINKYNQSDKAPSFMAAVVEKITSLLTSTDPGMPYPLKLEAVSDVGIIGVNYMLRIIQGIEVVLFTNLSEIYVSKDWFLKLHLIRLEFFSVLYTSILFFCLSL